MTPYVHAQSSAKKYGGKMEDYIHLHAKMDCSKGYFPDNRHRVLTHTMFWIQEVMIPIYGHTLTNSDGKLVSVKDICEQHILEDYRHKFIPTPQDFIQEMGFRVWMQNGRDTPDSCKKLYMKKEAINYSNKNIDKKWNWLKESKKSLRRSTKSAKH